MPAMITINSPQGNSANASNHWNSTDCRHCFILTVFSADSKKEVAKH